MSLITEVDILDEAKDNFLTYASEVLTDRSIPAAEDGLLSAQRKILWTMEDYLKMDSNSKTKKCNAIVGSTLSTSYYHGDQACYGVLTKLAQSYLMRYPLIIGQGSLGTQQSNDMVASSRYCLTGDTLIPTTQGTTKIQDIVPNSNLSEEYDINLNVLGFDGQIHHASKLFNSGKWPVLKITLANGMYITVTENHPLMVLDNELNLTWKLARQLTIEDKILLLVPDNVPDMGQGNDYLEAAMLGAMISEGYATTQNRIGINNKDLGMIEPVVEYVYRELPTCKASICKNKKRDYYEFCFTNKYFCPQFVKEFEFEKSLTKHLPPQYFKGNLSYKATLLSYLFEGDGSVDSERGITYSSISEELIHQLQVSLLQDFGIISNIVRTKQRNEIKLRINNVYAETFKNKINFISGRKQNALNTLVAKINKQSIIANGNICNIYKITQYIRNHYQGEYFRSHGFSNKKSYKQAEGYISHLDYEKIQHLIENYVEIDIANIELQPELTIVYSLKIDDESHAYIGNGFINHNTEAKPSVFADLMMKDFKKNVVPLKETYNGEFMEPVVLPGLFPNAICNGKQAIGISMSHTSAPCNLKEACNAIIAYIEKDGLTIDELLEQMPGPDFPLPNKVINKKDIRTAFATGHSTVSLKVRGLYEIKGNDIIFTSIPYRTYRNKIAEQIEKNVDEFDKFLEDFNDESSLGQNRLVFKVKKDCNLQTALNKIFALTDLQTTISYNMNYIVNGTPKMCSMIDLIRIYVEHQSNVLIESSQFDKEKAEKRKHILEGLLLILNDIDTAIELIKNSNSKEEASIKLQKKFGLDSAQAEAVLDMKLARLTKLDNLELRNELKAKIEIIDRCNKIINEKDYRNSVLISLVKELRDKYGDERRTELVDLEIPKEEKEIEYIEPEKCVITLSEAGNLRRSAASKFKPQRKGGKGVKNTDEITKAVIRTNTIDNLMIFSDKGVMYKVLVNDVPEGAKGTSVRALTPMSVNEKPATIYSIYHDTDAKFVLFVTKNGIVKKTGLAEFAEMKKKSGVAAVKLREDDELVAVSLIKDEDIIIITQNGTAIRFNSTEITPSSRNTIGVKGITLGKNDCVVGALPIRDTNDDYALFSSTGLAKRIRLDDVPKQSRGGKGVSCIKTSGVVAGAQLVCDNDYVLIMGEKSNICVSAQEIAVQNRPAQGILIGKCGRILGVSKV